MITIIYSSFWQQLLYSYTKFSNQAHGYIQYWYQSTRATVTYRLSNGKEKYLWTQCSVPKIFYAIAGAFQWYLNMQSIKVHTHSKVQKLWIISKYCHELCVLNLLSHWLVQWYVHAHPRHTPSCAPKMGWLSKHINMFLSIAHQVSSLIYYVRIRI